MNTNSNPTNDTVENVVASTENKRFPKVTTQVLGVSAERGRDLTGIVLGPDEISATVEKFLYFYGIRSNDIYSIRSGADNNNNLKIVAEIKEKALKEKKHTQWTYLTDDSDNQAIISDKFYDVWRNKLYHGKKKHLRVKPIKRNKDDKFVSIEIDPMIFIAFAYDIDFEDQFYKISAIPSRGMSRKEIDDMSRKERERWHKRMNEYTSNGMSMLKMAIVTYSDNSRGFHPDQVEAFFSGSKSNK